MKRSKLVLIAIACILVALIAYTLLRDESSTDTVEISTAPVISYEPFSQDAFPFVESIEYTKDQKALKEIIIHDAVGDTQKRHPYPEMDITRVSTSNGGDGAIHFKITFSEAIPTPPTFEYPYRIWLICDLDNDPNTGNDRPGTIGEEVAISITGWGEEDEWSYKTINKSELGKSVETTIEQISYQNKTLSFQLRHHSLPEEQIIGFKIKACASSVNNVDQCPDKARTLPFAFSTQNLSQWIQQAK